MLEAQIPLFIADLEANRKRLHESSMNGPTPDIPIEDLFVLFRRTKTMMGLHQAFCPRYGDSYMLCKQILKETVIKSSA